MEHNATTDSSVMYGSIFEVNAKLFEKFITVDLCESSSSSNTKAIHAVHRKISYLESLKVDHFKMARRIYRLLLSGIEMGTKPEKTLPAQNHYIGLSDTIVTKLLKNQSCSIQKKSDQLLDLMVHMKLDSFKFDKKSSYKFWANFLHCWSKCLTGEQVLYNEWTLLMHTAGGYAQYFIDSFCSDVLGLRYDHAPRLEKADPSKVLSSKMTIVERKSSCIIAMFEVMKEELRPDLLHNDDMKLFKCMRAALDNQIEQFRVNFRGVFGVLQGGLHLAVVFMKATCTENNNLHYSLHLLTPDLIDLYTASGYYSYYQLLCQVEYHARLMQENTSKWVHRFPPLVFDQRRHHIDGNTNEEQFNPKGDAVNLDDMLLGLASALKGRLSAVRYVYDGDIRLRIARYSEDDVPYRVALVIKRGADCREVEFLKAFDCPKIVRCFGSYVHSSGNAYILALKRLSRVPRTRSPTRFLSYCQDLVEAVVYLHDRHIIHRDIKYGNIGLHKSLDVCQLFDFNSATRLLPEHNFKCYTGDVGTEGYQAPEVVHIQDGYDYKCDIYSLGITFKKLGRKCSDQELVRDLVTRCTKLDPDERPSAKELLETIVNMKLKLGLNED